MAAGVVAETAADTASLNPTPRDQHVNRNVINELGPKRKSRFSPFFVRLTACHALLVNFATVDQGFYAAPRDLGRLRFHARAQLRRVMPVLRA